MVCRVIYSDSGFPQGVEDRNGNPSQLFQQINNNPHFNFDEALSVYQNIYAEELTTEQEPSLVYFNSTGEMFTSFKSALDNTPNGEVRLGVEINGKFKELAAVNVDSNLKNFNGMINNLIRSELILDETQTDVNGDKLYKPVGNSQYKKAITADSALHTAKSTVGHRAAKKNSNGDIVFNENYINRQSYLNKSGEVEYLTKEEIDSKSWKQLQRDSDDAVGVMAARMYLQDNQAFSNMPVIEEIEIVPENELQRRIKELLNNLGVKTVSLESYAQAYEKKNGIPPTAQALSDIGNQIIAFRDGKITEADLVEETAHFIIEATDPDQIENLLRNVHKTQEWNQYASTYSEIYQNDNLLRKEILGKVLANALQTNFSTEQKASTETSIIENLVNIFRNFFTTVNTFFKPLYQTQLEQYTKDVYNNIMAETFEQKGEFREKKFTLYSLNTIPKQYVTLQNTLDQLTYQQGQLSKKLSAPASKNILKEARIEIERAIENLESEIERTAELKALTYISQLANDQINYIERVVDANAKEGKHLAQEEEAVYQNFNKRLQPLLAEISNKLDSKNTQEKGIKASIDAALLKSTQLKGKVNQNTDAAINILINKVVEGQNLTGESEARFRENVRKVLEAATKDTSWFQAYLGQLNHAQNPLLNLAGYVVQKVVSDSRNTFLPKTRKLAQDLQAAGVDFRTLNNLIDKDGYIHHEIDIAKQEALDLKNKTEIYNSVTGETIEEKDFSQDLVNKLDTERKNDYYYEWNRVQKTQIESYFREDYLEQLNNASVVVNGVTIKRVDIPTIAQQVDNEYRSAMTQIRVNNNGINTEQDKSQIEELNRQRQRDSNPTYNDGTLKKGLIEFYDENLQQWIVNVDPDIVDISDEDLTAAQKVYGLQMLSLINRQFYNNKAKAAAYNTITGQSVAINDFNDSLLENLSGEQREEFDRIIGESREIPQDFIDAVNALETEQEKWDFVQLNSYLGFKREYWDNFGNNESLIEKLQQEDNEETDELITDIRTQQRIISNILKSYRVFNQPSETNVMEMQTDTRNAVRDAAIQLETLYSKARTLLPDSEEVQEPYSESTANESLRRDMEDNGLTTVDQRIDYMLKHMTPSNKSRVEKAQKLSRQQGTELEGVFTEDMSVEEKKSAVEAYAESKLLPYYKRTAPIGYQAALEELQAGIAANEEGVVENFIQDNQYLDINPSYTFYGQSEEINPRWLANRDAKRPQYTEAYKAQIRNDDYYQRYGINEQGNATRNLQEWQARNLLLEYQDSTIEDLNLSGVHNRYLVPQTHRQRVERFTSNLNASSIRESINDMINFREDEELTNPNLIPQSNSMLNIPVYGTKKLANQQDVSRDLWHSYTWMSQQAALTKARKENIQDMYSLEDALLNADYGGKRAETSNAFKLFKHNMDLNFFGVRESFSMPINVLGRKVDIGKLARVFNQYVRFLSLSGVTVPLTSLLQGKVQRFVEAQVGEVVNPIALAEAGKEYYKYAPQAMAEVGQITATSKMNVLLENYGVYNTNERFENATYNRATRLALNWNSGLHAIGNFPVTPKIALSVLMDYRYVDGKLLSYNQYLERNKERSRKELKEDWKKLPRFYDDISVKKGQVVFNEESIGNKLNLQGEELQERIATQNRVMEARITAAIQDIDTQIKPHQKSILATDARFNFFLTFLNYLILATTRKTKSAGYDIERGTWSEGSYVTLFTLLNQVVRNPKQVKTYWNEAMADDVKKRNLKRAAIEMGVANALAIMAISLANYVDDEEDVLYPVAFMDYFMTRVANEQISGTLALPKQYGEVLDSPLVGLDRFYDIFNIGDVFSNQEVTRGSFAGETEAYKYLSQNLVLFKDYNRLRDVKKSAQTYRHFNERVYDWALLSSFVQEQEDTEE